MKGIFGVANENIFNFTQQLKEWLTTSGISPKQYKPEILSYDSTELPSANIILVPSLELFLRWQKQLNESSKIVIMFGPVIQMEYLKPIKIWDLIEKTISYQYKFQPLNGLQVAFDLKQAMDNEADAVEVTKQSLDLIPILLQQTKDTVLSPVLTYLYSIPNTNDRTEVSNTIFLWMVSNTNLSKLEAKLPQGKPTEKIIKFLASDCGTRTVEAIRECKKAKDDNKTPNYEKVAKQYDITAFDIKYAMAQARKAEAAISSNN